FQHAFDWLITFTNVVIGGMYDGLNLVLSKPLYLVMMVVLAAIGWACANWKVGLFALIGFYLVRAMDQWNNTMQTLSLVVVAVVLALILAIPLGIWAAKSKRFSAIIKPILDFMQTMPSLAYLVPVIVLFGIGQVPGAIATIIFALPPGVRFTELGIRGVDTETVEAGAAFGASPRHILWRIQMPLAMPTVMAGVNQVIMLALSMVVLSGMVGAGGLGGDVVAALSQVDIGLGMEAGLAVVVVAVYLDRITNGLANRTPLARAQRAN
ncbi:MAG: ABC transporter permease subunit, partial [Cutibacterium avidum]|nr:ABC transporter permease subunit [Cutibacterium avidum]